MCHSLGVNADRVVRFDAGAVHAALRAAALDAWHQVTSVTPSEQVYGLALYDGSEYGYILVTPFTEEGLDRVVAKYRSSRWAAKYLREGEDGREFLRWSAADSPHHHAAAVESPPLVSSDAQFEMWDRWGEDDAPFHAYRAAIRDICVAVLRELDRDGAFGPARSTITLLVLDRDGWDCDQEVRDSVAMLNPPEVVERFDSFRASAIRKAAVHQARGLRAQGWSDDRVARHLAEYFGVDPEMVRLWTSKEE